LQFNRKLKREEKAETACNKADFISILSINFYNLEGKLKVDNLFDMEALEKKLNAKKLSTLNFVNNNNVNSNTNNNINFNSYFDNNSPSNKVLSMKILTFGHNCNFPDGNAEEDFNEDDREYNNKNNNLYLDNCLNKSIKSSKNKKAETTGNLADNTSAGKLLCKKIVIRNVNEQEVKLMSGNLIIN